MEIAQYSIVLVNLEPTLGHEINKTRPCVVISPDEMNKYLQTIVVAPMTSKSRDYPTRVPVKHNRKNGWVVLDQIRTIDRLRVMKILGALEEKEILKVKSILRETYID
ncbi:MAG: type II toxin-antitoxin system PemK/MazF family toxin [Bacteroidota bacterium]